MDLWFLSREVFFDCGCTNAAIFAGISGCPFLEAWFKSTCIIQDPNFRKINVIPGQSFSIKTDLQALPFLNLHGFLKDQLVLVLI